MENRLTLKTLKLGADMEYRLKQDGIKNVFDILSSDRDAPPRGVSVAHWFCVSNAVFAIKSCILAKTAHEDLLKIPLTRAKGLLIVPTLGFNLIFKQKGYLAKFCVENRVSTLLKLKILFEEKSKKISELRSRKGIEATMIDIGVLSKNTVENLTENVPKKVGTKALSLKALKFSSEDIAALTLAGIEKGEDLLALCDLPKALSPEIKQKIRPHLVGLFKQGYAKCLSKETLRSIPVSENGEYDYRYKTFGHHLIFGPRSQAYKVCAKRNAYTLGEFVSDPTTLLDDIKSTRGIKHTHTMRILDALIDLELYQKDNAYKSEKVLAALSPNLIAPDCRSPIGVELKTLSAKARNSLWTAGLWRMLHILPLDESALQEKHSFTEKDLKLVCAFKKKHNLL